MANREKFRVIREHGAFVEGDEREAVRADVEHLIPHVLEPIEAKAEKAPQNKAEVAPANKADTGRKAKTKAGEADQGEVE